MKYLKKDPNGRAVRAKQEPDAFLEENFDGSVLLTRYEGAYGHKGKLTKWFGQVLEHPDAKAVETKVCIYGTVVADLLLNWHRHSHKVTLRPDGIFIQGKFSWNVNSRLSLV